MRVLHVIQELRRGGAETVVRTMVGALLDRGVEVEIAAAPGPWRDAFPVPVHPLPIVARRPHLFVTGTIALARALRRARPDLVHCHNPTMALLATLPTLGGRRPRGLVTVHGVPEGDYPRAAKIMRPSGLEVVACGPAVREALTAAGGRVSRTILNGVPASAPPLDRGRLNRELDWTAPTHLVASVGRLVPDKRHDLAVRAVALLPDTGLLIVGAGPDRPRLETLVRELGVADRVVLTGLREDVSALLGAVDALVVCSRGEGLPLTVLEGLTAGVPVVCTDVPGIRELIRDGVDGLMCRPDPVSVSHGLQRVLHDTDLAERLRCAGREAAGPYSERRMVEDYLDAYTRLLGTELA